MVKKSAALAAASQKSDDGDHGKASDPEDLGSSSPKIEVLLRNIQEMARDEKAVVRTTTPLASFVDSFFTDRASGLFPISIVFRHYCQGLRCQRH
mmetsp:Transcript_6605/g.13449  ORF Transcript_6605/g.13449 Transcript_6605/m.13449 type:complete len:95 (+) Transcript_6605:952-1236(+)